MNYITTHYRPEFEIELTVRDVEIMALCSDRHYDFKCQSLNKQGGRIYGFRNMLLILNEEPESTPKIITVVLAWRDVDILCKVLEQSVLIREVAEDGLKLLYQLHRLLTDETNKIQAGSQNIPELQNNNT